MELTLKRLLEQAVFEETGKAKVNGYNCDEVDEFLDRAVAMATKVEAKLTQAMAQAQEVQSPPADVDVDAEVERRLAIRQAEERPVRSAEAEEDLAEQVRRTIVIAERTADAAVREARDDAERILAEAKGRAATTNAELDRRAADVNADIEAQSASARAAAEQELSERRREAEVRIGREISELEGAREALRTDVSVLERHLDEQRSQLRSTVGELQRLLDDPSGFRLAPMPALIDPEIPDEASAPTMAPQVPTEEATSTWGDRSEEAGGVEPAAEPTDEASRPAVVIDPPDAPEPVRDGPAGDASEGGTSAQAPSPAPMSFDEVDHEAPGIDAPGEAGPPTAPVSAVDLGMDADESAPAPPPPPPSDASATPNDAEDEDAFLAELRKAMADDEPLGPRDHQSVPSEDIFGEEDRRSWRFGKRR